jgi:secondary thiamine-phosphate synthase enzyme
MIKTFEISTRAREELVDITPLVAGVVAGLDVSEGVATAYVPHTTAGVMINENADSDVKRDILARLAGLVPEDGRYAHAEGNSDAHIKTALVGSSVSIPFSKKQLLLGTWQGIFFAEFDGPRKRKFVVATTG